MNNYFFPGFRDTSDLFERLESWLSIKLNPVTLPGHKWFIGDKRFSLREIWNQWEEKLWNTGWKLICHSLSSRTLIERLSVNEEVKFVLLNPGLSPEVAVKNMYNFYNRREQVRISDILNNPLLYPWLISDEVEGDSEQFQKDLNEAVLKKEEFKRTLDSLRDRCLVFVNPDDRIIDWKQVIEDFWNYVEINWYSIPQAKWIAKWHIPQLWAEDFVKIDTFMSGH